MFAAALGVFGASFQSTLGRSQQEQALYRTGGDLEVQVIAPRSETRRNLAAIPAVHSLTPVKRDSVTLLDVRPGSSATLLAFDPVSLVDVTWFREDFSPSGKSLSELLTPLRRGQSRLPDLSGNLATGVPVPEAAESIGLWVNTESFADSAVQQTLSLWLRLSDAGGSYFNLNMGDVELSRGGLPGVGGAQGDSGQGWIYYEAPLPLLEEKPWLDRPFNMVAIYMVGRSLYRMPPGSIYIDDLSVKLTSEGSADASNGNREQVIEEFEDLGRWVAMPHDGGVADRVIVSRRAARSGTRGMEFTWQQPLLQDPRGMLIPPGDFPLAAVGSPNVTGIDLLRISTGTQLVPLAVQDVATHFPTMTERNQAFLLVSLKSLTDYTARIPRGIPTPAREFWVALEQGADRQQVLRSVREATSVSANIRDRRGLVEQAERDPLAGGGWNGLTLLGMAALTIVVTLALATHAMVAVRTSRVELAVVRAMGFSRGQLVGLLILERALVAAVGLVSGGVIGYYLGRWTLGLMDMTSGGLPIVPPMILAVQTWLIGLVILNLVIAVILAIIVAGIAVGRLRPSDILRNGG